MPPITHQVGQVIDVGAAPNGGVVELAPGYYPKLVARGDHRGKTIVCPHGGVTVGNVDIYGIVRDLHISNLEVVAGPGSPDVGIQVVGGSGAQLHGITFDGVKSRGFLKGWGLHATTALTLLNCDATDCGSLGFYVEGCTGYALNCVNRRIGGNDPNRDVTMTRGVYVSDGTIGFAWRDGFFDQCSMNGVRSDGDMTGNLVLRCGMGVLHGNGPSRVADNGVYYWTDPDPLRPWIAGIGGVECSASHGSEIVNNHVGFGLGQGGTIAYNIHGDGSYGQPPRRYGSVAFKANSAVSWDQARTDALAFRFDEWGSERHKSGAAGNWGFSPTGGRLIEARGPDQWLMSAGSVFVRSRESLRDPTRDPMRYVREILGAEALSVDAACAALGDSIEQDRTRIADCRDWIRGGSR